MILFHDNLRFAKIITFIKYIEKFTEEFSSGVDAITSEHFVIKT